MSGGWRIRSRQLPTGEVQRWHERDKPGCPGVVECHYIDVIDRIAGAVGTAHLSYGRTTSMTGAPPAGVKPKRRPDAPPQRRTSGIAPVKVVIHPKAAEQMDRMSFLSRLDDLEIGGWLAGTWDGSTLHVTDVTNSSSLRETHRVGLDYGDVEALKLMSSWGVGFPRVGDFHCHPAPTANPSPADFQGWESGHASLEHASADRFEPYYVGIIGGRGDRGRAFYRAWVVRREGDRLVTEPAAAECI